MSHPTVSRRKTPRRGPRHVRPAGAAAAVPRPPSRRAPALRLWILKTYVEPTNKAIEASAAALGGRSTARA